MPNPRLGGREGNRTLNLRVMSAMCCPLHNSAFYKLTHMIQIGQVQKVIFNEIFSTVGDTTRNPRTLRTGAQDPRVIAEDAPAHTPAARPTTKPDQRPRAGQRGEGAGAWAGTHGQRREALVQGSWLRSSS